MLIKFLYGNHYDNQPSGWGKFEFNTESALKNWGERYCNYEDANREQLVQISDTLIFGLLSSGLSNTCMIYYELSDNKIYFCNNLYDIDNYRNNGYANKGYVTTNSNPGLNEFDWGESDEEENDYFCYEVPQECFNDFYEVLLPYIKFDFNRRLRAVCYELSTYNQCDNEPVLSYEDDNYSNKNKRFQIRSCAGWFWTFLIKDMNSGTFYKEYNEKYPRSTSYLCNILVQVQNYYNFNGDTNYDPRFKSK